MHGEDVKLRHVINNSSGTLRPLIEKTFNGRMTPAELRELVTLVFYPKETLERLDGVPRDPAERCRFVAQTVRHLFELIRVLSLDIDPTPSSALSPTTIAIFFRELLHESHAERTATRDALVGTLVRVGRDFPFIRLAVRVVRDLAIDELIIALRLLGPKGPRRSGRGLSDASAERLDYLGES